MTCAAPIIRSAFLFPGQGSQAPGLLASLREGEPRRAAVEETYVEARRVLGFSLEEIDSDSALQSTTAVQLSTLIAGVAYTRLLQLEGAQPDAVAGLSVGAFAAAVASGALPFEEALRLVKLRGETMEREFGKVGFGMAAILGSSEAAVQRMVQRLAPDGASLHLASINSSTEIVIAGSDDALRAATLEAERGGARVRRLHMNVPSHGALLDGVSQSLREAMSGVRLERPRVPYISNHRARAVHEGAEVAEDLILNVSRTVRWYESLVLLYELGARLFVELPPGRALSNLVRSEFPLARAVAAMDTGPDSIVRLIAAQSLSNSSASAGSR
jgi:malonate decarboxylase epsilon subunit